ncbi:MULTISPECIES: hypothetical protein [unclassified Microbacterium]|uniref:hypothetical protein n=1 Tax=unclassified Microbacterium TaxID=2609290 RepID=UPI00214ABC09|nr:MULTISPECIES: hypothetical protein [unclassified Microbacterium]MCR2810866.1 hypothetical protein [Microbacterium sp. zg.B185]WIM19730.1 hypothetical protein QNO12_02685 [Microbacterium sp. zg-B185]
MLSIVHAAEAQFHHEVATRERESALLASIRERRAAQAETVAVPVAVPVAVSDGVAARQGAERGTVRAAWPRPIGITACPGTACAVA